MDRVHSVEELLQQAAARDMRLEEMRFFINEDRHEPRCFGIYQDEHTGEWIVYKNKTDGSRAVRYVGPDEAHAAQEVWAKINSEVDLRRAKSAPSHRKRKAKKANNIIIAIVVALIVAGVGVYAYIEYKQPRRGYYVYDDSIFYYQNSVWYCFDDYYDEWERYDAPADGDWYEGAWYGNSYPFEKWDDAFLYSSYYEPPNENDANSDSSLKENWDVSDTDWNSDW